MTDDELSRERERCAAELDHRADALLRERSLMDGRIRNDEGGVRLQYARAYREAARIIRGMEGPQAT